MVAPLHIGLDGISFSYPGGHRVLTDIAFAVPSGSVTGLIGENGAGKSTLLGVISGELHPDAGTLVTPPLTGFIAQETSLPFTEPASSLIDAAVDALFAPRPFVRLELVDGSESTTMILGDHLRVERSGNLMGDLKATMGAGILG